MQTPTKVTRSIVLCMLLALPGCFSLSRGTPTYQHYVLGGDRLAEVGMSVGDSADIAIGLRSPRLADYLATPFVIVRQGTHRIGFSEFDRWGEDLVRGISRVLAGHLAGRAPFPRVELAPWPAGAQPAYLIQLHVLRFEGVAPEDPAALDGEAHLLATWEIFRSGEGAPLARGTTEVRADWRVGDFSALVRLLDEGLGTLAEELDRGLQGVLRSSN
jgi:hypothetical protein